MIPLRPSTYHCFPLIPGFVEYTAQCLTIASVCLIVLNVLFELLAIAIALALWPLRISVKISPLLNDYRALHAPFLVPKSPPYLRDLDPSCFRRTVHPSLRGHTPIMNRG